MKNSLISLTLIMLFLSGGLCFAVNDPGLENTEQNFTAPDQAEAIKRSQKTYTFVRDVLEEPPGIRSQRLIEQGIDVQDIKYSYFWLDSPILQDIQDLYQPVRFMHSKHASSIQDCTVCHHAKPAKQGANETVACSACHQEPFKKDFPDRIGLKAAYHIQCMGCHENEAKAPTGCQGCHLKKAVDHRDLVELPDNPSPFQVTENCLGCHQKQGEDVLKSAHWLWRGPSPYTLKHRKNIQLGKASNTLNNF